MKEVKITAPDECKKTKVYKIAAPNGCEIENVEIVDGVAVVTFREKERLLPKSWEEFCDMFPIKDGESYIQSTGEIEVYLYNRIISRYVKDKNILPDRATAEAVLALCQLIQLRNCYNGDWMPDWGDDSRKYVIEFSEEKIETAYDMVLASTPLFFKTAELCDEFLKNFRPLIEKLKPLYGVKEGGKE